MADRIPPKGQTVMEITVDPVPHGVAVVVTMRSLTLGPKVKDDHKAAMLYAWRALGAELQARGTNLVAAMAQMPEPLEREDLSDGPGPEKSE